MKKFFTSIIFTIVFVGYGLYRFFGDSSIVVYVAPVSAPTTQSTDVLPTKQTQPSQTTPVPISQPAPVAQSPSPVVIPTPVPAPAPVVAPTPQGQYVDGTYTGSVENAYYGNVQVQVTVSSGQMTDVAFLQYPSDRSTSRYINSQAMPILKTEAIQSQNAQVDTVSGASDTSEAFRESLANALSQAKS